MTNAILACAALILLSLAGARCTRQVLLSCGADDEVERGPPGAPGKRGVKGQSGVKGEVGMRGEPGRCEQECGDTIRALEERISRLENQTRVFGRANCDDLYNSGATEDGSYYIYTGGRMIEVYCQFQREGHNWLVFQRRTNGAVDFYRNFQAYKVGFGDLNGEFWLGLANLHAISSSGSYQLRVDLEDFENNTAYALYSSFSIGDESSNYRLSISGYSGNAGDSLEVQNNHQFTTFDRDNDNYSANCAVQFHGAWWYENCHYSNLNGEYGSTQYARGLTWYHWKGYHYSMKFTEMKIRPN